jgi:cytosine/creatinine deaminase
VAAPRDAGVNALSSRGRRGIRAAMPTDEFFMSLALQQAAKSFAEGGLPIGAVLVENDAVISVGHNRRVQCGDPTAHGEIDCLRAAGRRVSYRHTTLYTTLSPCMMCAGTIVQFKIPRVIVGEDMNFKGNVDFLRERQVAVTVLHSDACIALMRKFISAHPDVWNEDIAE